MQKKGKIVQKPYGKQIDFVLLIIIILLLSLGIIMVLSASAPSALAETGNSYTYVTKQAIFAVLGFGAMFFFSRLDYRILKRFYWPIYWISVGILLLVLVPGLKSSANGATRWINLGFGQFQPSEVAKIGLIVFYAAYLADHKNELGSFLTGFVKPLIYLLPPIAILFFIQDHLSASIIIIGSISNMKLMAGTR